MTGRSAAFCLLVGSLSLLSGCLFSGGPTATFTVTPESGHAPLTCTFDASSSTSPNGAIAGFAWDLSDGATATGETITHTYTKKGTYQVTLTVTDASGAAASVSQSVRALGVPPTPNFVYGPSYATSDNPVEFDGSESSPDPESLIVEWLWSFGDGTTGDGMTVEHTYPKGQTKTYDVRLTVIDSDGLIASVTRKVTIYGCSCGG